MIYDIAIGLGSNIGNSKKHFSCVELVLARLSHSSLLAMSPWIKTKPLPSAYGDAAPYLNAIAILRTQLPPDTLMRTCLDIEKRMGRVRGEDWGYPRTMDIDLLCSFELSEHQSSILTLPHSALSTRGFWLYLLTTLHIHCLPDASNCRQLMSLLDPCELDFEHVRCKVSYL